MAVRWADELLFDGGKIIVWGSDDDVNDVSLPRFSNFERIGTNYKTTHASLTINDHRIGCRRSSSINLLSVFSAQLPP